MLDRFIFNCDAYAVIPTLMAALDVEVNNQNTIHDFSDRGGLIIQLARLDVFGSSCRKQRWKQRSER